MNDNEKIIIDAAREAWGELYVSLKPDHPYHQSTKDAVDNAWCILQRAFMLYNDKDEH